ncbi:hypothetical protein L1987_79593 [Smallanthus sonchifolius]|uniref:Uncharacterized protein n=1 Tax=Smallanthus sonchifolius TaxID=185202 RepID=A0ACB8YKS7_9ASTR|nr:hypothetical protein L1987_79593 [Smallanthus sonchifolius]
MKGNHSDLALRPYLLNSIGKNGASRSREVEEEGRRPEGTDASVKERHLEAMGICYWWRLTGDVGRKEPFQSTDALVTGPEIRVYVNDQFLNWDPAHRIKVRIVSARAYHSLFMHNMCIRPTPQEPEEFGSPDFTIYNAGMFSCNRYTHYMTSSTSIDLNLARREMVILGTQYAGTGKTTLSTDHNRYLIGDDEHCWSENGVSNIEGGCYAKCIDLSKDKEPDIFNAIKFGTVMENVVFDEHTREVDYSDKSVTENTRAAYPIEYIPNAKIPCVGPHPKNVILLACDAVSKLSLAQTMYHFISGYTALVAGTEDGIKEPQATFSACFGAAFIMLHPTKYAAMLAEKMKKHGATGWLGWSGGRQGGSQGDTDEVGRVVQQEL